MLHYLAVVAHAIASRIDIPVPPPPEPLGTDWLSDLPQLAIEEIRSLDDEDEFDLSEKFLDDFGTMIHHV